MIRDFQVADVITLANGGAGTAAIFLAMDHVREARPEKVYAAGALVLGALLLDVLDGRVARWRHQASPMGRELDSLADIISFGVAPACLAYAVGMTSVWDVVVLLYFVACGISRLARYNITADGLAARGGKVRYFEGMPIPANVLLVLFLVLLAGLGRIGPRLPLGAVALGPFALHPLALLFAISGSLMVSKTLRIPKP
jgi:CDP-diacylglycerol--serine O-phosphatidyltransferase